MEAVIANRVVPSTATVAPSIGEGAAASSVTVPEMLPAGAASNAKLTVVVVFSLTEMPEAGLFMNPAAEAMTSYVPTEMPMIV